MRTGWMRSGCDAVADGPMMGKRLSNRDDASSGDRASALAQQLTEYPATNGGDELPVLLKQLRETVQELVASQRRLCRRNEELERQLDLLAMEPTETVNRLEVEISEREHVEEALRGSETLFRQLAEAIDEVFWLTDWVNKKLLYVSPAYETVFGMTSASLRKDRKSWAQAIHPDDRRCVVESFHRNAELGRNFVMSYRIVRPDGSLRWIRDRVFPILDDHGAVDRVVGVAEDVTQRKNAELALKKSEAQTCAILAGVVDGIITINEKGIVETFNPAAERIFGWRADEIVGKNIEVLIPTPHKQQHGSYIKRYIRTGIPGIIGRPQELVGLRRDGTTFPMDLHVTEVPLAGYRLFAGVVTDVTERKTAQDKLKVIALRQTAIATLGQYALTGVELGELFGEAVEMLSRTLNADFCKVLELQPDANSFLLRAGKGWHEGLVGVATVPASPDFQAGYTLSRTRPVVCDDLNCEHRFARPNLLVEHDIVCGISVVIAGDKRPFGVLGVHSRKLRSFTDEDITFLQSIANVLADAIARKSAEQRVKQHEAELAHYSRLNTMGEMATGLAHELNQPLSAIMNFTEASIRQLQSETCDVASAAKNMERVVRTTDRAGQIIRRLKDLVRKSPLRRRSVQVNTLIRDTIALVISELRLSNITLRCDLRESIPMVHADAIQIQQVILNLIRNAIEALQRTGQDGRTLTVLSSCLSTGSVEVTVCDTGPGLAPQVAEKIFEPFITTKPEGLGMGLSISRSIIGAHGGHLAFEPNVGRGAIFRMTLPSLIDADVGDDAQNRPEA